MTGAIYFSGKYGSTEQYGKWISEATGLPIFNIKDEYPDPRDFDFVVLGSSILYFKLSNRHWVKDNLNALKGRTKLLFSVSGAGPGDKLDRWVSRSLPQDLLAQIKHIGLRGKLDHSKVSGWVRMMLWIGSLFNSSKEGSRDERYGFDYMDKSGISPIVEMVEELKLREIVV